MAKRNKVVLVYFRALMALVYLLLGIFLLSGKSAPVITDTMTVIVGIVLVCMGLVRGYSAYNNFRYINDDAVNENSDEK